MSQWQLELSLRTPARGTGPSLLAIAESWLGQASWPEYEGNIIGMGEPFCAGCAWLVPLPAQLADPVDAKGLKRAWDRAGRFLDRAHLVDHAADGRDDVGNLVALCSLCHRDMPSFSVGQRDEALAWVKAIPRRPFWFQVFTDTFALENPDLLDRMDGSGSRSWLRRGWEGCLEAVLLHGPRQP